MMAEMDQFLVETLDSGVQVVGQPMEGVQSAAIGFFVGTGARDEAPEQAGVSHLTEALMFRGTKHLSSRELTDRLDSLGVARDSNSGLEMTLFSGVMLGNRLEPALDLFLDVLLCPAFPADDLEAVRALQLQEIAHREDQPAQIVMDRLRRRYFEGSPLSHDTLGTVDTVRSLAKQQVGDYWQERYTANNLLVAIAGSFNWRAVVQQLSRVTAGWAPGAGRMLVHEPDVHPGTAIEEKTTAQENIGFVFPAVAYGDPHYYDAALTSLVLGGGMNSRLFSEVREKRGLAYAVSARCDGLEKAGIIRVYAGTQPDRAHETVDVIRDQLRHLAESGVTDDELRLAKTRLKSQVIMQSESTGTRMMAIARDWWYAQRMRTLRQVREEIERVSIESIHAYLNNARIIQNLALVAIGPISASAFEGAQS